MPERAGSQTPGAGQRRGRDERAPTPGEEGRARGPAASSGHMQWRRLELRAGAARRGSSATRAARPTTRCSRCAGSAGRPFRGRALGPGRRATTRARARELVLLLTSYRILSRLLTVGPASSCSAIHILSRSHADSFIFRHIEHESARKDVHIWGSPLRMVLPPEASWDLRGDLRETSEDFGDPLALPRCPGGAPRQGAQVRSRSRGVARLLLRSSPARRPPPRVEPLPNPPLRGVLVGRPPRRPRCHAPTCRMNLGCTSWLA